MNIKKIVYAILFIFPIFTMDDENFKRTPQKRNRKNALVNSDVSSSDSDKSRSRTPIKEEKKKSTDSSDSEKTPKKNKYDQFKKFLKNDPNRTPKKSNFPLFVNSTTKKEYLFQPQTGPNNETPQKGNNITFSPIKNTPDKYNGLGYKE